MASASNETSGTHGPQADESLPTPEGSRRPGIEGRMAVVGEVSSLMVHEATQPDGSFSSPAIEPPGKQIRPPKDPSVVNIDFRPPPSYHERRWAA
jgi:hypothetical protein